MKPHDWTDGELRELLASEIRHTILKLNKLLERAKELQVRVGITDKHPDARSLVAYQNAQAFGEDTQLYVSSISHTTTEVL
jgi:hypothetical protein